MANQLSGLFLHDPALWILSHSSQRGSVTYREECGFGVRDLSLNHCYVTYQLYDLGEITDIFEPSFLSNGDINSERFCCEDCI